MPGDALAGGSGDGLEPQARSVAPKSTVADRLKTEPRLILVVDDHLEIRELLTEFLRRLGLIAIPAPDSQSACVVVEKLRVDLILLDLVLPDAHGVTLIPQFRKLRPQAPIVVLSGHLSEDTTVECQSLGADEVLRKPVNLKALEKAILRLLGISPAF